MARDRSFGPRLYSVRNFTPLRKPEPRSVNGINATAFPNWLQYTINLIAYRRFRSRIPTRPGAASPARSPLRRADLIAVRIRYKNSVAILRAYGNGKLRGHRSLPSMVPPFLRAVFGTA
jgi:hypothetical protein